MWFFCRLLRTIYLELGTCKPLNLSQNHGRANRFFRYGESENISRQNQDIDIKVFKAETHDVSPPDDILLEP